MTEQVSFPGYGGEVLSGVLHRADRPRGGVLMAHCFTCSKDLAVNSRLAKAISEGGHHVLRFDFTGLGESGGDFESSTLVANVGDLTRAAQWMLDQGLGPTAMVGHSLGGAATLIAANRIRTVRSVAVIGAPSEPSHVLHLIDRDAQEKARIEGCTFVSLAGRTFPISNRFLEDLGHYDAAQVITHLGRPLLVMHSPTDDVVDVGEGERIFARARQPKAFFPLVGADHLLTRPEHAAETARALLWWFDRTAAG